MKISVTIESSEYEIFPGMRFHELPSELVEAGERFTTKMQPIEIRYHDSTLYLRFDQVHELENICINTTNPHVKLDGKFVSDIFPDNRLTKEQIDAWFESHGLEYSSRLLISCYSTSTPDGTIAIDVDEMDDGGSTIHFSPKKDRIRSD